MNFSVMITTRDRAADLADTLRKLRTLEPPPDEVLVTLDGCTDDSLQVVQELWPAARVFINSKGAGSIPARDLMLRAATSELVLTLDDDSYPLDKDFIPRASAIFKASPKLAVLWFPQRSEEFPQSLTQTDFGTDELTGSYSSSGAVLRRSTYLELPGYPACFGHAYEEPDYALQCTASGMQIVRHTGQLIRHRYSVVNRNELRTHHQHARNECWSVLMRCPAPWWPFVLFRRIAGQFAYACRRGGFWILCEPVWWWRALRGSIAAWRERKPVSWSSYRKWRDLLRRPEALR